nr:MAG TPA: hypothetical protein [Caudoviricetes sp.]
MTSATVICSTFIFLAYHRLINRLRYGLSFGKYLAFVLVVLLPVLDRCF